MSGPMPVGPEPQESTAAEDLDLLHRVTLPELRREVEHQKDGKARWRARAEKAEARVAELESGLPVMQQALFKALDRVSELEAERHTTNEALDDAVKELRARDTSVVLDDFIARCEIALSGCCSECDAAIAIVKGRKQAALDNAPVPERARYLSEDELRKSLRGHLFGGGA